jgi:hypothetical protein
MEFSVAEMYLGAWAIVMTILWVKKHEEMRMFRYMTIHHLRRLIKKEVRLVDDGKTFIFEEIKKC